MFALAAGFALLMAPALGSSPQEGAKSMNSSLSFADRAKDWRCGAVVYQVFVDRFHRSGAPDPKSYAAPQTYHPNWSDLPKGGKKLPEVGAWSHELEFWGGDLKGVEQKLDYIKALDTDVLYLTPIFASLTNHRYDAQDYMQIDPHVGTEKDFGSLVSSTHKSGMKIVLDGVFNHMGASSRFFQDALKNPTSPYREWYVFDKKFDGGYKGWAGVANLPALNLENKVVRDRIWNSKDSIVRHYLNAGIDGWRLDVAFEIGPTFLGELTRAAHETKPGSAVLGELSGYPADWFDSVDGTFNFFAPNVVGSCLAGKTEGGVAGQMLQDWINDAGMENALRSWIHLDNHDTSRIASMVPDFEKRKLMWASLFLLPGSPVIYYGSELGLAGQGDPGSRAPMPWDQVSDTNKELSWVTQMLALRKETPAFKIGNFEALRTNKLIAWVRSTDKILDTRIVVINPTAEKLEETFPCRIGRIMSWGELQDELSPKDVVRSITGLVSVSVPPFSVRVLKPLPGDGKSWSPYHRIP